MKKNNYKILIVDDIQENLQVLGSILGEKNIAVLIAKNGRQAIKIALKKQPDLILLDINMPELNGYQTCEILKKDEQTKNIPIIFLSALNEKNDIVKGFDSGGVDYITKPFNKAELLARVFTHLELKYSRDKLKSQNKELEDINATKNKFFSIISHDLRAPFNSLIGFTDLLLKYHKKYDEEKREDFIKLINNTSKNTLKLLENLLTWSHSQSGKIKYLPEKLNLKALLFEIIFPLQESADKKNISILDTIPENKLIFADRNMLSTVLRNLISNAIKFTNLNGNIIISSNEHQANNYLEISAESEIGESSKFIFTIPK